MEFRGRLDIKRKYPHDRPWHKQAGAGIEETCRAVRKRLEMAVVTAITIIKR
jgi:hypothetical protein